MLAGRCDSMGADRIRDSQVDGRFWYPMSGLMVGFKSSNACLKFLYGAVICILSHHLISMFSASLANLLPAISGSSERENVALLTVILPTVASRLRLGSSG